MFCARNFKEIKKSHNVNCMNNAIQGFQLLSTDDNQLQYNYTCTQDGNLTDTYNRVTDYADFADTRSLDSHNVECGENALISDFVLYKRDDGQVDYEYKCIKSDAPLICRDMATSLTESNDGDVFNLDQQHVICNNDEALQSFQLINNDDKSKYYYKYKCCRQSS